MIRVLWRGVEVGAAIVVQPRTLPPNRGFGTPATPWLPQFQPKRDKSKHNESVRIGMGPAQSP
jgi:hypothetical protein